MEDECIYYTGNHTVYLHLINDDDIKHEFRNVKEYKEFVSWFSSNDSGAFVFNNVEGLYKTMRIRRESILFIKE